MRGLSLVIPNHNGAKVIERSVREYNKILSEKFKDFEMIIVCNGCTDNSAQICNELSKEFPLQTIEIPQRGKGYALVKGFNKANFDCIGFLDADNPFDLAKVGTMIDKLDTSDVVIATKYLKGSARFQESLLRRLISLGGGIFSRSLFRLKFRDTQAGAKFFRKEVWESIDKNFICTGFDWDIEFLYKICRTKSRITEYHVSPLKHEKFSTVSLKYLPGMAFRLLKLRFK